MEKMLNKIRVKRSFSRAAATYDQASIFQRETARLMAGEFRAVTGARPGNGQAQKVLDIGSGTGHLTGALREVLPENVYYCCDIARSMLMRARENFRGHAAIDTVKTGANKRFVCADAEALPFAGEAFDALVSNLAFQWVPDTVRAFAEAGRVLTPEGFFLFTTLGPSTLKELRISLHEATTEREAQARLRLVPFREMESLTEDLEEAGFRLIQTERRPVVKVYENPVQLLRTLKYIGALDRGEICSATTLVKGSLLKRAFSAYERAFPSAGGVRATYEVIFMAAKKVF